MKKMNFACKQDSLSAYFWVVVVAIRLMVL